MDFHNRYETPGGKRVAKTRKYGNYVLSEKALECGIDSVKAKDYMMFSPLPKPVYGEDGVTVVDYEPFLTPYEHATIAMGNPDGAITTPGEGQYDIKSIASIPVAWLKDGIASSNGVKGGCFTNVIDAHPEGDLDLNGKTLLQGMCAVAPAVLSAHPEWMTSGLYDPNPYNSCLAEGRVKGHILAVVWAYPNDKYFKPTPNEPLVGVVDITKTGMTSLANLIFAENQDYTYPAGDNEYAILANRENQKIRFLNADLCDPKGSRPITLSTSKQHSGNGTYTAWSASLGDNEYVVNPEVSKLWIDRQDLYNVLGYEEMYKLLVSRAMSPIWYNFLIELGRRLPKVKDVAEELAKAAPTTMQQGVNQYQQPQYQQQPQTVITPNLGAAPPAGVQGQPTQQPQQWAQQPQQQVQQPMMQQPQQQVQQPMQQQPQQQVQQSMQQQQVQQPQQQVAPVGQEQVPGPDTAPPPQGTPPADHPDGVKDKTEEIRNRLKNMRSTD